MNVSTALREATQALEKDHINVPRLTAEVLLAHALQCPRAALYAHSERELTGAEQTLYWQCIGERLRRKPTQYITGQQEFYGRMFRVTPAVLIPRSETELVAETALRLAARWPSKASRRILDVGTGSGCLAITLQKEIGSAGGSPLIFASDVSLDALEVARENARRLEAKVEFCCAEWLDAFEGQSLDLIVSNPPYVPDAEIAGLPPEVREHEPSIALRGGAIGTEPYLGLLAGATRALLPGGCLITELAYNTRPKLQAAIEQEMRSGRWSSCAFEQDLAGFDRVLVLQRR